MIKQHEMRFITLHNVSAVVAPGESSDQATVDQTSLQTALDCLPFGSYIVGGPAYTLYD